MKAAKPVERWGECRGKEPIYSVFLQRDISNNPADSLIIPCKLLQNRPDRAHFWTSTEKRTRATLIDSNFVSKTPVSFCWESAALRKPFIAGNWKMNLLRDSSLVLVHGLIDRLSSLGQQVEVAVCPPSVYLHDVGAALRGSNIALGAQNVHAEAEGAFTGEVSGPMLKDLGCRYAIVGHSERRQYFHETDAIINQKAQAAFRHGLLPIVCVGETLQEREAGSTAKVIDTQVRGTLTGISSELASTGLVIAYEPVWAIGTGKTATPAQAEQVHAQIRSLLIELLGAGTAQAIRIQYGGSVKPENASELMSQPNIDGALVGGASLKAESFAAIVNACCTADVN
jgi:triosephosphate isomerase